MNIILLKPEDRITETSARITGDAFQHCVKTLKVSIGVRLSIGLIHHKLGIGIVRKIDNNAIIVDTSFEIEPPAKLPLSIILAMPRPKVLKRVLRNAAELGVKDIVLLNAYKVEKSYWQSPIISDAMRYFQEGLEQAKDCIPPKLSIQKRFKPFVEDDLAALIAGCEAFVAHPDQTALELNNMHSRTQHRWVVIGPEGGFIPYEVDKLVASGCQPLSMGNRIYRVENAVSLLVQGLS